MVKNRVHAILLKHGYQCPYTDAFGVQGRAWLATLSLRPVYQQALQGYLQILDTLRNQIHEASDTIDQEAKATPIVKTLCTLPGVGHYTALLIVAEIGVIARFPDPKHLVSYAGLAPIVRGTGGRVYTGHISKQGSTWMRWILVEAAFHAVRRWGDIRSSTSGLRTGKAPSYLVWWWRVNSSRRSIGYCVMPRHTKLGTPPILHGPAEDPHK